MKNFATIIFAILFGISCFSQNVIYVYRPKASFYNVSHGHYKNTGAVLVIYDLKEARWLFWIGGQDSWDMKLTCNVNNDTLFLFSKNPENFKELLEDKLLMKNKSLISLTMKPLVYKKRKSIPGRARDLFGLKKTDFRF